MNGKAGERRTRKTTLYGDISTPQEQNFVCIEFGFSQSLSACGSTKAKDNLSEWQNRNIQVMTAIKIAAGISEHMIEREKRSAIMMGLGAWGGT